MPFKNFKQSLRDFFVVPSLQSNDIYEESKYILTCKLFIYTTIAMFFISVLNTINFTPSKLIPSGLACIACFISFVRIKKTGKFTSISLISNIIGALLLVSSLYANPKNPHIVEGLWMINSSLLVFLTLGKKHGIIFTLFHALNLSIYYFFFIEDQVLYRYTHPLELHEVIGICVSILVAFGTFIYFNWLTLSTNILASKKLEVAANVLKNQFETISKQHEEKSVMLKEIHHRVKNNLQLIISLLRLQSREFDNQETIAQFEDAVNRIVTISLVHEKMYQTEDFSQLDLQEYFSSLGNDMIRSHRESHQIEFQLFFEVEKIKLKPIVPIALIFNELISNSLKHGKKENEQLIIQFHMKTKSNGNLEFIYSDNGTWINPSRENSFGLELIEALSQQIEATMTFSSSPKTEFHFIMKNPSDKLYVGQ